MCRLNDAQKQAVTHWKGPLLALAGPGSGKTLVITKRIEYLIRQADVDPSQILVITFTKAAAEEMRERFLKQMPSKGRRVTFGTFHAVFFMVLKHAYHFEASNIIREEERVQFMRDRIYAMSLDFEDEAELIQDVFSEISHVKNARIALEHFYPASCAKEVFCTLFREYRQYQKSRRKIDFDDMLVYTYELFAERKDILSAWQKKYRYILIDEFQDVNQIQYDIVRMLAEPGQNLFAVGDDDQSIYRFRGARPEIMLHMPTDYPNAKVVNLSCNYRCPRDVVTMASSLIAHNQARFPKEIVAASQEDGQVTAELFATQWEEYEKVAQRIRAGTSAYAQTAVLFRTNTQARLLMELLMEYNIPFTAKDKTPGLYEHWIAKDLFAYLRIAQGSRSRRDFLLIMNRPNRYLSRESLGDANVSFDAWQAFYLDRPWMEERIEKLRQDISSIQSMRPFAAVNYIRKAIGYDEFLAEYAKRKAIEPEGLTKILDELQEACKMHPDVASWSAHAKRCQEELREANMRQNKQEDAVTLATFHSAKGLEFDVVHMIDVNEGITPYKKAVLPSEMEEERRMFYVGMTRAKKKLHMYAARTINHRAAELSRFLLEAQEEKNGRYDSSKSASSSSSSNRSSTASYSSSSSIFSMEGLPSSSSK